RRTPSTARPLTYPRSEAVRASGEDVAAVDEVLDGAGDLEHFPHRLARLDYAHVRVAAPNIQKSSERRRVEESDAAEIDVERLGVESGEPRLDTPRRCEIAFSSNRWPAIDNLEFHAVTGDYALHH